MRAVWVVIAIACSIMVEYVAGFKARGNNCCNGDKILDTIQRVMAYGVRKEQRRRHNDHFTAFTAYLANSVVGSQDRQKVVFEKVVSNYGNAYNNKDGVFTCPIDGVYSFTQNLLTTKGQGGHTRLIHNGHDVPIHTSARSPLYDSATMSVVLQLKKGDRVWVVTYRAHTLYGAGYSTFSGWLLHEI